MKPKTPVILSKKWIGRSFHLKVPMRTNSAETLKAGTVVTTTGELTKSRWFVCVTYPVIHKRGVMRLKDWVRRKDILNINLAVPVNETWFKNMIGLAEKRLGKKTVSERLRELKVLFSPIARPSP